tara:strand:- start:1533 stop:3095 length:1563 start_codon:yes stop_codon:yes gene_type:complete
MAITAQKLLPRTKVLKPVTPNLKPSSSSGEEGLKSISIKLDTINSVFLNTFILNQKNRQIKRREEEEKRRKERENELEKGRAKKDPKKLLKLPGASLGERIQNFLAMTLLGWVVDKFAKMSNWLKGFLEMLKPIFSFLDTALTTIFNSSIFLIESFYTGMEKLEQAVEDIGGKKAKTIFDKFTKEFNKFLNATLIMGMLWTKPPLPPKPPRLPKPPGGGGAKITPSAGKQLTIPGLKIPGDSVGSKLIKGAKLGIKPGIGAGIFTGLFDFVYGLLSGESLTRASVTAVGTGIGTWIGTVIGGMILTAAGIGTGGWGLVLTPLILGGSQVAGATIGSMITESLYDWAVSLFGGEKRSRGGQLAKRSKNRKSSRIKQTPVIPLRLSKTLLSRSDRQFLKSVYRSEDASMILHNASNKAKKGIIGGMMGVGIDMTLGKHPTQDTKSSIADSLISFMSQRSVMGKDIKGEIGEEIDTTYSRIRPLIREKPDVATKPSYDTQENNTLLVKTYWVRRRAARRGLLA